MCRAGSEGNTDTGTASGTRGRGKGRARVATGSRQKSGGPTTSDVGSKGGNASTHNTSGKGTGKQRAQQGRLPTPTARGGPGGDSNARLAPPHSSGPDTTGRSMPHNSRASLCSIPGALDHDPLIMADNGEFSEFINFLGAEGDMNDLLG